MYGPAVWEELWRQRPALIHPLNVSWIDAVGVTVHNEEHPQLRVIKIIDHDKGRASDSMRAKINFRIAGLYWKLSR